jgi:hypothetical protein
MLQWARKHGARWDEKTCAYVAAGGHLHVLKWARAHGCPWSRSTFKKAARRNRKKVLKWALKKWRTNSMGR